MQRPTDADWGFPPKSTEVLAWVRARGIVEFFVALRQRETVDAFLAQYDGPQDHDAIRDAFRLFAPDISA